MLSLAALLLHAAALGGLGWGWPQHPAAAVPNPPVWVRLVEGVALAPAGAVAEVPAAVVEAAKTVEAATPARRPSPARAPTGLIARPPAALGPPAAEPVPAAPAREAAADTAPPVETLIAEAADPEPIPHYRTRIPPATTLRYELLHGLLRGTGELTWRPQGDHYELRLDGRVGALKALTQISSGGFDTAGVAPDRYTDQRLRRAATAANFQREAGKITFSGPSTEYPLRAGAQDRLSWMVQLGAILAAEPQRAEPGARIAMFVVGARGEAGIWLFRCIGSEAVETGIGRVEAIKFVREPRDPHDTTVQVWLDPQRHGLPVRATQKSGPDDEGFELRLEEVLVSG